MKDTGRIFAESVAVMAVFVFVLSALAIVLSAMGCSAACQIERGVISAFGAGLDAADDMVGDRGGDEYDRASGIAHDVHDTGRSVIDACEALLGGDSWVLWLLRASQAALALVGIIEGASADIDGLAPIELRRAIARIEHELSLNPPSPDLFYY